MLEEQRIARRERKRSSDLSRWYAVANALYQELPGGSLAEELEALDPGVTTRRQSLGHLQRRRRPWPERPDHGYRKGADSAAEEGEESKRIGVRPMEVVQQQEHRLDAPPLQEAQHTVEAGGPSVGSDNDRRALGFDRGLAAEVIESLAEDAEWQGGLGGVAVARTDGESGSGELTGAIDHRRLSESSLSDQEEHASAAGACRV
jgi:hypothetical protein